MYPDQNQPPSQPQYSIDYLNQIAPKQKKAGLDNKKFLLLVGGGLLVAIIVGIFALSSNGGGPKVQMETLAARLLTLQTISANAQKNIKSGALRGSNSDLTIFLTNANHAIIDPLSKNGVQIVKIDKKITTAENGAALTSRLEDARLNAVYDRTYAREMGYQLDTVAALMKSIYTKTKSTSLRSFLVGTDNNLEPIKKQLNDFNATDG